MSELRRVTSTDVAREAGVSRTTVSFVLNDEDQRIPEDTRQRVREAAERLGFVPYAPARLLNGSPSRLVLVLTPELTGAPPEVGGRIVAKLGERLAADGLDLVWQFGAGAARAAMDLTPCLVLASARDDEPGFADLVRRFAVPVLPMFPGLTAFHAASGAAQAEHLIAHGHRVLVFAAPDDDSLERTSAAREQAVRAVVAATPDAVLERVTVPARRDDVARALDALLQQHPDVTAVCAYNDHVALQLLGAATDLGVAVPDRLAVIGVDDIAAGQFSTPALTTVTSDVDEFVERLAAVVVARAVGGQAPDAVLPTRARVVARASA